MIRKPGDLFAVKSTVLAPGQGKYGYLQCPQLGGEVTALLAAALLFTQGTGTADNPYLMPPVVITATRLWLPADLSAWPVEVYRTDDDLDLSQTLNKSTTADVRPYGQEGSASFSILGGILPTRILILADGLPMNSRRDGVIDLSLIPVYPGDRVEIVKGPLSALYGSSAVGGVVNVITSHRPGIYVNVKANDNLGLNTRAKATGQWGIFGASAAGGYLANPEHRGNDDVTSYNGKGSLWARPLEQLLIELNASYVGRELGVPGEVPDPESIPAFGDSHVSSLFNRQGDNLATASLRTSFTAENFLTNLNLYTIDQKMDYHYRSEWMPANNYSSYYNDVKLGADLQLSGTIRDKLILAGGFTAVSEKLFVEDTIRDSLSSDTLSTNAWDASEAHIGSWAEVLLDLGKVVPTAAVRVDNYNSTEYGLKVSPEAGISVNLVEDVLSTSLAYGQSFRAPTLNDKYWPMAGDSALEPETGQSAVLSVNFKHLDYIQVTATGSWKDIKDMIVWSPNQFAVWEPENLDKVRILSGELTAYWWVGILSGSAGMAYCNATEETAVPLQVTYDTTYWYPIAYEMNTVERKAAYIPPLSLKGNLAVRPWTDGLIDLSASWTGSRVNYYTSEDLDDETGIADVTVLEKSLKPSLKIDLSLSQKFFDILKVKIGVKNILDDRTPAHFGSYDSRDFPTSPRRFYGALSVSYR